MPVNLTNSTDLIANSISLVDGNQVVDIKDQFLSKADGANIVGLAPEDLNTIEAVANALNNDPNYFANTQAQLALKANISETHSRTYLDGLHNSYELSIASKANSSDVYTKTEADDLLDTKVDAVTFATNSVAVTTALNTKAPKDTATFTGTTTLSGDLRVVEPNTTITTRKIQAPPSNNLELGGIVSVGTNLNAPSATFANTLAVNNIDVETAINAKANQATTYTKTETDTLLGAKASTTFVTTELDKKANQSTTYTKTETDTLLDNKANSTDVTLQLATKADQATTYTKTETDNLLITKANQVTTYTKTEVDTKFTDIINSAPDALNTLSELADALANDSNYATTIANQLATKANSTDVTTALATKEDVLIAGSPANGFPILTDKRVRGLVANAPLTLVNDGSTSLTINADVYSKAEVDNALTNVVSKSLSGSDTIIPLNDKFRFVSSNGAVKLQRYDNDGTLMTDAWIDVCGFNFDTNNNASSLTVRAIESDTNQVNINDNVIVGGNFSASGASSYFPGNVTVDGLLTIAGTVSGITKDTVGLGNVDNTSDANKPISTDTQTALDAKASALYVNTELGKKADKTTTYTKTETDTLLGNKANSTDVTLQLATKADTTSTYTRTEIDNKVASRQEPLVIFTPSGGSALIDGIAVKGMKVTEPMTLTDASNTLTFGVDLSSKMGVFTADAPLLFKSSNPSLPPRLAIDSYGDLTVANITATNMTANALATPSITSVGTAETDAVSIRNSSNTLIAQFANNNTTVLNGKTYIIDNLYASGDLTTVRALTADSITTGSLTVTNPTTQETLDVGGEIDTVKQEQSSILQNILQLTPTGTLVSFALGQSISTGTANEKIRLPIAKSTTAVSDGTDDIYTADLKAPFAIQRSSDSTLIADFQDNETNISGTLNSTSINCGQITATTYMETPKINIPGANATDAVTILNTLGSIVAKFQNDYNVLLNGPTNVLGDLSTSGELYSSGPATMNQNLTVGGDLTVGILKSPGTSGVKVQTSSGSDVMKIWDNGTTYVYNDMIVNGNLTVNGSSNISGGSNNQFWIAARINVAGTVELEKGQRNIISCVKGSGDMKYTITYPTHPDGENAIVLISSTEYTTAHRFQSANSIVVYLRNLADSGASPNGSGDFNIAIFA